MTARERLLDELRPVAFAIAYRMLGSVSEAEDVVQEALLRVHQSLDAGEQIASPRAFVATVTTRLAINELRSARARRERYVGEWLPEPIITDGLDDPAQQAEMADSLSLAMLVLLESLSPEQRAVLLRHDVFDYGYPDIAGIIGKSEDHVRQLATRARRHVEQRRPRFQTTREQRDQLARRFFQAAEQGDLAGLEALLAHDVQLTGGGGKAPALARSLRGRNRVARTVINWVRRVTRLPGVSLRPVELNGGPGALVLDAQQRLIGRVRARHRRRSDHKHQRDRQPRQADAPRAGRRLQIAAEVGAMNSGRGAEIDATGSRAALPARGSASGTRPKARRGLVVLRTPIGSQVAAKASRVRAASRRRR
jgi:RNA polymerase sigma-70 factor (ECF subfamily)